MSLPYVTYAGLQIAKGAKVTLTRGFTPDNISVRMIPQTALIAERGDLTIGYGIDTIVFPNCLADKSNVWMTTSGFTGTIVFQDRRWLWWRYPAVTYHFNVRDYDGIIIDSTRASLRSIVDELLVDIGEADYDLSVISDNYFPEIDIESEPPASALQRIFFEHGFTIALNTGDSPVTIFGQGLNGDELPTFGLMSYSRAVDPPTLPQYVRVNYGPSIIQARFTLVPVALDTDGEIKDIDDLSYTPAGGWESSSFNYQGIFEQHGRDAFELATLHVWKMYRIDKFTGNTLALPDGSGTLNSINDVLPLKTELLRSAVVNEGKLRDQPTVWGSYFRANSSTAGETESGSVVDIPYTVNAHSGIVLFDDVLYSRPSVRGSIKAPDIVLEAAFSVKDSEQFGFVSHREDIEISVNGVGFHNVFLDSHHRRAIVNYDRLNAVESITSNEEALDLLAAESASVVSNSYTYRSAEMAWYNRPRFDIRLDGQITQIMHVVSDTTDGEPGHYSVVGRNLEFDRFIRSEAERRSDTMARLEERRSISRHIRERRRAKGNG